LTKNLKYALIPTNDDCYTNLGRLGHWDTLIYYFRYTNPLDHCRFCIHLRLKQRRLKEQEKWMLIIAGGVIIAILVLAFIGAIADKLING